MKTLQNVYNAKFLWQESHETFSVLEIDRTDAKFKSFRYVNENSQAKRGKKGNQLKVSSQTF